MYNSPPLPPPPLKSAIHWAFEPYHHNPLPKTLISRPSPQTIPTPTCSAFSRPSSCCTSDIPPSAWPKNRASVATPASATHVYVPRLLEDSLWLATSAANAESQNSVPAWTPRPPYLGHHKQMSLHYLQCCSMERGALDWAIRTPGLWNFQSSQKASQRLMVYRLRVLSNKPF